MKTMKTILKSVGETLIDLAKIVMILLALAACGALFLTLIAQSYIP